MCWFWIFGWVIKTWTSKFCFSIQTLFQTLRYSLVIMLGCFSERNIFHWIILEFPKLFGNSDFDDLALQITTQTTKWQTFEQPSNWCIHTLTVSPGVWLCVSVVISSLRLIWFRVPSPFRAKASQIHFDRFTSTCSLGPNQSVNILIDTYWIQLWLIPDELTLLILCCCLSFWCCSTCSDEHSVIVNFFFRTRNNSSKYHWFGPLQCSGLHWSRIASWNGFLVIWQMKFVRDSSSKTQKPFDFWTVANFTYTTQNLSLTWTHDSDFCQVLGIASLHQRSNFSFELGSEAAKTDIRHHFMLQ